MNVKTANLAEVFAFPNLMNLKNCKFIKYGHYSINQVLEGSKPHYYSQSVLQQIAKTDRNFVYHVELLLPKYKRHFKKFINNDRIYQIHVNMSQRAHNIDVLKSYYLVRLIDNELQKKERINTTAIEMSIRNAEREFAKVDFGLLKTKLEGAGWSLDYIYLDPKKNRYTIE